MKVKSESEIAQSCPTLSDPMDCSPPGSSVHGIFQARILEWVAVAHHKYFGNLTHLVVYFYKEVFESWKSRKYFFATLFINCCCLVAKSCLPLCDPMDNSPPGSSVHGISQARKLEWVAISFSRGSSWPRDWTRNSCITGRFFTTEPPGKPLFINYNIQNWTQENGHLYTIYWIWGLWSS